MRVSKRKPSGGRDGAVSATGAAKRARTEELTGVRFKALLRDPQGPGQGLEAFVSAAKKLPQEDVYDVVEGYIKISVECAEIFQLLSGEKRPESEVLLIFQVLEAILLRTASDLSHFHVAGTNIVKKLMNNHMKLICESLYASGYRVARSCLNLMAAMVTQGPEAARDVCSHFDLNKKNLYALATKRDSKGVPDVRLAYIQFALSFLIAGDDSTIGQVLELKEFIPCIFSSGIKEDRISTINILLSTLQAKVVHNKNITKTQKVRFFTGQLLVHIASLYNWNGIADVTPENSENTKLSAEEAGKAMVRELAHNFLLDLCCSFKHGINFYDASLGTFGRGGNLTLLHFLLGLKTAASDELVAELVVNILKVCPDLLSKYFKEVTFSFLPRVKSTWLNNIRLLTKIYEAQPEISRAFQTKEFIPLPRLLAMVMVTTVPLVCNKIMFTQALNLDSTSVRHTALSLTSFILKRALKTVDHCLNKEVWQESNVYTVAVMEEFVQLFREALSKVLPDLNTIVWVWQSLKKQETKEDDGKGKKSGDSTAAAHTAPQCDDAETILLKAVLLQVICLYQKVVPHVVMQYNFDFSKLLKGIISEQGLGQEAPPVLQHHMLKVALELPATKFLWLKSQEGPGTEIIGGERSVFYLLMKMFVTSSHLQLKSSTKLLIVKILRDTGVFEYTWKELELWLEHLDNTSQDSRETVIQFLERVSTDVLDMVDVLVEGSEGLDEEIGFLLSEDMILLTFPFSAVVPAALEARNKLLLGTESQAGESIVAYLTAVLTDLLHTQRDPLALCLLLQAYDKFQPPGPPCCQLLSRFNSYYSLWIPEQAREAWPLQASSSSTPHMPTLASGFSTLLQTAYESRTLGDEHIQEQLQAAIECLPLHRALCSAKQVLLYIRSTVENFRQLGRNMGPPLLRLFLDLLTRLVVRCEQLDAQNQQKCKAAHAESDLFLDMESVASLELANDQTLEEVLVAVLRHPTLEGWFLALEQQALPQHALSPVLVKLLAAQFSAGVLPLLVASAPILQNMGQLGLLAKYSEAITQSVLRELHARSTGRATSPPESLPQLEALQKLHPYMEGAQLRKVTLALLALPEAHLLIQPSTEGPRRMRQLSVFARTLAQLLVSSLQDELPSCELWFSEYVRGFAALLPVLAVNETDVVFLHILQRDPLLAPVVSADLFNYCLARQTQAALGIATLLLQHSYTHLLQFECWCSRAGAGRSLQEDLDDFLPLIHVYLQRRPQGHLACPAGVSSAVIPVLKKALWKELRDRLFRTNGPLESELLQEVLAQLLPFARAKDLRVLMDRLPGLLLAPNNYKSWMVADSVSAALEGSVGEVNTWRKTLLQSCVQWLVMSFSGGSAGLCSIQDQEKQMLLRLSELLHALNDIDPDDWQKFMKTGLKFRYQDHTFIKTLHAALQLLYGPESMVRARLAPLRTVHMLLTQHSLFLPSLLTTNGEENPDGDMKEALVDLMATVVRMCPSVCESSHFAVLLGAYGATLSTLDQKILLLLRAYEENKLSLINFRVLLWGPAAVEHHKTCRSLGKSLWQQPSVADILCLLDRDRMLQTILHFPQRRRLLPPEGAQEVIFKDKSLRVDPSGLYDPCFLLHLFGELTRPEFVVDCRKFLDSNALSLTIAALSSYDPQMRAAAYSILAAFYSHLEGARFREQSQLLYLLDVVRNGIRTPNLRLPFTLALFIAKAALQILRPEEHMYWKISKFLLSHEYLNMDKVPGFYQFFYSSDFEHKTEQEWVLGLLRQGIRDKQCYELCARRGVFHIILSFFSSPLCDEVTQNWILEILQNIARVARSAYEILRDYSLLTWILHILESRFLETQLLANVISLLHTLWVTNLGDKGVEGESQPPRQPGSQEPRKLLALHLVNEFLYVLLALVKHLRPTLASAQLSSFFETLDSVLRYRASVLQAFKDMGRFTVNETMLSTKDVLLLLHKWSLIERDMMLQAKLRATVEKCQVRDLMKMLKDKTRPVVPARARGPRGRKRRPGEAEEAVQPELAASRMCKALLRSILTHWAPVVPGSKPSQDQATQDSKATGPVHAATSLVASWVLCSVAESPLSRAEAAGLLGWLKSHILPHPVVVADLVGDGAVRRSLFQLYSRLCGAEGLEGPMQDVAILFNMVMLQLLGAQGHGGSPFHLAVEALCASCVQEENGTMRASAAFLVSLYIKDIWLGAQQPDTLLAHIQMVCKAAEDTPDGEEEAIVVLCRDIAASASDAFSC
ncbi:nucleolar pre-ribosomal-associated protein 1 isoform X2 [Octodon degus]|uniref:Nucleolar pre-ribosomal-associated protein 1 isoform X2 n=1 Tax=Octodon degus TaxID=10160 RepID=A0A6P6DN45_OCTDE|nr:nucleolar pre-ribosomal-associated protein 1 isoform X2 [Octodon degus]